MSQYIPPAVRTAVLALCTTSMSQGALLVYEGFNGYTVGELNGQAANSNSQGLSGNWDQSSYTNRHLITSTGLTFDGLLTNGGALTIGNSTRLTGIAMSHAGVASGGTLYSSYLVRINIATGIGSGILTRVNGTSATTANGYYNSFADGRGGTEPAVSYDTSYNVPNHASGSSALTTGNTFIVISSFTNVGNSSPGDANLYVLNQAQYTNLLAIGINNLSSLTVGQNSNQVWASAAQTGVSLNASFDSSDFLHILSLDTTGTIDEIRYATTLAEVLPIPEPSSTMMMGAAAAFTLLRRRRK